MKQPPDEARYPWLLVTAVNMLLFINILAAASRWSVASIITGAAALYILTFYPVMERVFDD